MFLLLVASICYRPAASDCRRCDDRDKWGELLNGNMVGSAIDQTLNRRCLALAERELWKQEITRDDILACSRKHAHRFKVYHPDDNPTELRIAATQGWKTGNMRNITREQLESVFDKCLISVEKGIQPDETFYHITPTKNWEDIQKGGLQATHNGRHEIYVHLEAHMCKVGGGKHNEVLFGR